MKKETYIVVALVFSTILNLFLGIFVAYPLWPIYTGNYQSENISMVAKIQRANFLSEVLKKQFELDGGKNLPTIISQLAQNPNPQLWTFFEGYVLLKMDSRSFNLLTREETEAVIAHELAHVVMGHFPKGPNEESRIEEEIEADNFAGRYVSRQAIIRSIKNESRSEHEKIVRMKALGD